MKKSKNRTESCPACSRRIRQRDDLRWIHVDTGSEKCVRPRHPGQTTPGIMWTGRNRVDRDRPAKRGRRAR